MQQFLDKSLKIAFIIFLLILPSFVLSSFINTFDFPKLIILAGFSALVLVLIAVELGLKGKLTLKVSNIDLPLLGLVAVYVISTIIKTQNKMEAFVSPGIVTVFITGFLLYFFAKMIFKEDKSTFTLSLFLSGVLVSILSIFAYIGVFSKIPQLPAFIKDQSFSPIGGKLPEIIFLATVLPLGIYASVLEKDIAKKIFYGLASAFVILSIVLSIIAIMPGKPASPLLVDYQTSWSVAVDTLKVSPIWGIGPSNYLTAFSRFLPVNYNSTTLWSVRFSSARSFLLTLTTETGILGLIAFGLVVFLVLKKYLKDFKRVTASKEQAGGLFAFLILTVSLVLFPANSVLVVLFFFLIFVNSESDDVALSLSATKTKNGNIFPSRIPSMILSLLILCGVITFGYFATRAISAERNYKLAIDAISQNDGKTAYNDLAKAISLNPLVDRYHATFDQLSLALARSLAQKTNLTDSDKSTIAQLIQQSINEAKATVVLNPLRSSNWELLARTYEAIIPFAQGADNFSIQTFTQAIALDPINPNLRIALGGVYYALGRYSDAINMFTLAATAKPDLANAYYNLAIAYRDNKEIDKAIAEMNTVLTLVQPNTQDYATAKSELDNLQKNKTATGKGAVSSTNLTAPQPAQVSNIKPPLTLPSEATPPAATQ